MSIITAKQNWTVTGNDKLSAPWWFVQNIDVIRDASGAVSGIKMSDGRVITLWFKRLTDDVCYEEVKKNSLIRKCR